MLLCLYLNTNSRFTKVVDFKIQFGKKDIIMIQWSCFNVNRKPKQFVVVTLIV